MSLADSYADLEAHLEAALDHPEAAVSSGVFRIDSIDLADWAMRKIADADRRLANDREVAQAQRDRIDEWLAEREHAHTEATEFLRSQLEGFHRRLLDDQPVEWHKKKDKTLKLPSGGRLVARAQQPEWTFDDEAFVAWATTHAADLVRTKHEPDRATAKERLTATNVDGRVVLDGELVPGVTVTARPPKFEIDSGELS